MDFSSYGNDWIAATSVISLPLLLSGITGGLIGLPMALNGLRSWISRIGVLVLIFAVLALSVGSFRIFALPKGSAENILREQAEATYGVILSDEQARALRSVEGSINLTPWEDLLEGPDEEQESPLVEITLPDGEPGRTKLIWTGEEWRLAFYASEVPEPEPEIPELDLETLS